MNHCSRCTETFAEWDESVIGSGCAASQSLVAALARRAPEAFDVEIVHILTFGEAPYSQYELLAYFRHNAFFIGSNVRDAVNEGLADYTPIFLSEIPALLRQKKLHLDLALVQVSPPDAHGFGSFGVSVDVVKAVVESTDFVVAEVNPNMPRTLDDRLCHSSQFDALVKSDLPILEHRTPPSSPEAMKMDEFIASLVERRRNVADGHRRNSQRGDGRAHGQERPWDAHGDVHRSRYSAD